MAGTRSYDSSTRTASFTPSADLAYSTGYQVTVTGHETRPATRSAPTSWTFTTRSAPPPSPTIGPGGPIGVVTSTTNPFSTYFAEILRAEGLNSFATFDVGLLNAAKLAEFTTVVLGDVSVTTQQVSDLTAWVQAGGNLIASRPDAKLAPLLGIAPAGTTLSEGYIKVDAATAGRVRESSPTRCSSTVSPTGTRWPERRRWRRCTPPRRLPPPARR